MHFSLHLSLQVQNVGNYKSTYLYTTYSTGYISLTSTMDSERSSVHRFVALGIHLKGDGAQI